MRSERKEHRGLNGQSSRNKSLQLPIIIGGSLAVLASLVIIALQYQRASESSQIDQNRIPQVEEGQQQTCPNCTAPALSFNVESLFDPVQVNYIKSYEESAVGKYYYWDLLAEEYFRLIKEQLIKIIWMEEEVIEQFFNSKFNQKESAIIKKKVWKLREKCSDIEVGVNLNNKPIWKYKHCYCVDPVADRSKLSI